ncbi:MAG: PAS domain S-box protein [Tepidisphaeraceae bacterium]
MTTRNSEESNSASAVPSIASVVSRSDELVAQLLAISPDCVKIFDLDGQLLSMNAAGQAALEIDDVTRHLGTCWADWWADRYREIVQDALAAGREGRTTQFEAFAQTVKGTPKWWHVTVAPLLGDDNRPAQLLSVSRDITAQRSTQDAAAERSDRLRSIIASAKDYAVISLDLNGFILGWSTGAVDMFGYSEAEAVGQHFSLIWPPEERDAGRPAKELQLARDSGVAPIDRWHERIDGKRIWVVGATRPVRNSSGQLTGYVKVCRDETERRAAETALRKSEAQYQSLVDSIDQGFCILKMLYDADGRPFDYIYEEVNGAFERQTGLVNPVGRSMREFVPDFERYFPELYDRVAQTGEPVRAMNEVPGMRRWFDVNAFRVGDPNDPRVAVLFSDVTEQRLQAERREELLRTIDAERRNLAEVVKLAPSFMCVLRGPEHVFELANEGYYSLIGRRDIVGKPVRVALPEVEGQGYFELLDQVYRTGNAASGTEVPVTLRDGRDGPMRTIRINFVYQPLRGAADAINGIFVHGVNVTESVQAREAIEASERQRRLALDAAELGSWHIDAETLALRTDARFSAIFDLPGQNNDGRAALAAVHPEDRERVRAAGAAAMRLDDPIPFSEEFRVVHRSGDIRWVFGRGRADFSVDAGGARKLLSIDGTVADITERKQLEAEREQLLQTAHAARAEAERASRMKDEFLATLSHELRTPLSAILGWSQLLRQADMGPAALDEGLATIERNARVQTQIIEDLLDMSRIISGKISLDAQRIDLGQVVRAAMDTVRPTAAAKGVELFCETPEDTRYPVLGDFNRLQQVFWNLLTNAVKFTPRGGRVQVRIEQRHSQWQVDVIDSGEGIEESFLPFVFDRFRQADSTTTRKHGGLGLGLAIVKQLTELHGGKVRVRSRGLNQGTTFIVSLPVSAIYSPHPETADDRRRAFAEVSNGDLVETAVRGSIDWDASLCEEIRGRRIVVIDDEPDARTLLQRLFERCGATVYVATNADETLEIISRERPDLLVSDIGMPGVDGYELLRRVRQLGPGRGGELPAIALTAFARTEDRVKAVRAGFQTHVPKPVDPAELITMVSSLIVRN